MDFDAGLGAGLGGIVGGGIATVLDWLDRRRVDDKFGSLGEEINNLKTAISTQDARHVEHSRAIEKVQDSMIKRVENIDSKIDLLLVKVGELTGAAKR